MMISRIKIFSLLVTLVAVATVQAQVLPNDKTSQKFDMGFGVEQSEFLSTAAVTTISGEELQQTSAISLADALYGKLPGLNAYQRTGFVADENKGATFNIRGYQTTSEKDILILVDGFERPIDRLTVEEVESVTVYKDAAAVALFGLEAVNGVILVKTKRGQEGKTHVKVGYSHKFTFDPEFAPMLDAANYAMALNVARVNDGLTSAYSADELALFRSGADPYFYPNIDWKDIALRDMGSENRANLSVFGGTDKVRYYTMLDYTDSKGLLKNTEHELFDSQLKYSKANVRTNVDFAITPTTKMSVNLLAIFMETSRPNDAGADDVSWNIIATPNSAFPLKMSDDITWGGNEVYADRNLAAKIEDSGYWKTHQRQLWADATLTQDLSFWVDGLSVFASAGYDNASIMNEHYNKAHQYGYEYYIGEVGDKDPANIGSWIGGNLESQLNFSRDLGSQWRVANFAVGANYKTSFREDDNFAATLLYNIKSEVRDGRYNTFNRANIMGSFHYDLKNKYVADLVLAANGSNRSYPAKWSFSPTLSLGYIYANNPGDVLTYGKVRASAGIQHTDYVPAAGLWIPAWDGSHGSIIFGTGFGSNGGTFLTSFPTTDFAQERAIKFNLGTDLRFWNALDITADAYYNTRDRILVSASEENSWVVGIQSSYRDVGKVNSYGVEFSAKFAKEVSKDLFVNVTGMVNWGQNEIAKTIENPAYPNNSKIGKRVDEAWGLEAIGFFESREDINNSPLQEFSIVQPGDVKYKDQNGDGVINELDEIGLGYSNGLPALNYAFSVGVEYKGIGLNATFQGAGNAMKNFRNMEGVWGVLSDNRNISKDYYNNSWDVAGADAIYPRLTSQANPNNDQNSDVWFRKINFLKLRYCELYYKLPQRLVERLHLGGAKVFVQGQNLLSFDNVDAMDAEMLSTGFPVLKSVNVGLSLTF